jgi:hypothetical protein
MGKAETVLSAHPWRATPSTWVDTLQPNGSRWLSSARLAIADRQTKLRESEAMERPNLAFKSLARQTVLSGRGAWKTGSERVDIHAAAPRESNENLQLQRPTMAPNVHEYTLREGLMEFL